MNSRFLPILGGAMTVAGTAIGAGMLALPLIFRTRMLRSSQAILKVNLHFQPGDSFHTLVRELPGPFWSTLNGLAVSSVLYTLVYACVSGGSVGAAGPRAPVGRHAAPSALQPLLRPAARSLRLVELQNGGPLFRVADGQHDPVLPAFHQRYDGPCQLGHTAGGRGRRSGHLCLGRSVHLPDLVLLSCLDPESGQASGQGTPHHQHMPALRHIIALARFSPGLWRRRTAISRDGGNVDNLSPQATNLSGVAPRILVAFSLLAVGTSFRERGAGAF